MAEIAKSGTPSLSSTLPAINDKISGLLAGEDLAAGDACRVNASGAVVRASGAAANANARVRGFVATAAKSGEAVTLVFNVQMRYGAGLTPGADLYLSGTVLGGLADLASTGGTTPIAFAVDATRIRLLGLN